MALASVSVDLDAARHMGVAEAKEGLSGLLADIQRTGRAYVIERYGRPAALVVRYEEPRGGSQRARGSLSAYARPDRRALEEGAFARAMEAKHERAD